MHTSWNKVSDWYGKLVGESGHYFHQHVILPKSLPLLDLQPNSKLLDVGCGNGWFSHQIPPGISYLGIDSSTSLINTARSSETNSTHKYQLMDITGDQHLMANDFSHAIAILSLQNMENPDKAIVKVSRLLRPGAKFLLVLNHPVFRIPRQTEWGIDEKNKIQYRRINRYLTPLKIPINSHPGQPDSPSTWSFHHSLSDYSRFLHDAGFQIARIEEWVSDKESVGKAAKMENMARLEFPLFMAILAVKI